MMMRYENKEDVATPPFPSPIKKRQNIIWRSFLSRCCSSPALTSFSPLLLHPSNLDPIVAAPRDRRGRGRGYSTSFSKEHKTNNRAVVPALPPFTPLRLSFSLFLSLLSYSPWTPPLPGCVHYCMCPDELVHAFPFGRLPHYVYSTLRLLFHFTVRGSTTNDHWPSCLQDQLLGGIDSF